MLFRVSTRRSRLIRRFLFLDASDGRRRRWARRSIQDPWPARENYQAPAGPARIAVFLALAPTHTWLRARRGCLAACPVPACARFQVTGRRCLLLCARHTCASGGPQPADASDGRRHLARRSIHGRREKITPRLILARGRPLASVGVGAVRCMLRPARAAWSGPAVGLVWPSAYHAGRRASQPRAVVGGARSHTPSSAHPVGGARSHTHAFVGSPMHADSTRLCVAT